MPLIFFVSFYLAEGGNLSVWGSDVKVDIFAYNFIYLQYFLIVLIVFKSFFYGISFGVFFA